MTKLILSFEEREDAEAFERRLKAFLVETTPLRGTLLRTSISQISEINLVQEKDKIVIRESKG